MQHNDAAEFFRSRPLVVAPMAGGPSSPELAAVDPTDAWDAKCAALRDAWSAGFGPAAVSVTFGLPTPELIAAGHAAGALVLATVADPAAVQKAVALGWMRWWYRPSARCRHPRRQGRRALVVGRHRVRCREGSPRC